MPIDESEWSLSAQALRVYIARRVSAPYVDDLVGEILLRMADGGSGFSAAAKPMAWMYRVASNLISDHYRRQAIEQRIFSSAESQPGGDSGNEEEEASAEKELALCLLPLIKALPELYREALQLVDIEGQTQVLAARRLAISLAAMKSRVRRGRQQLKQHLLACCRVEINRRGLVSYESKSDCC